MDTIRRAYSLFSASVQKSMAFRTVAPLHFCAAPRRLVFQIYTSLHNMSLKIGVINTAPIATNCSLDPECPARGYGIDTVTFVCAFLKLNCSLVMYPGADYGDVGLDGNASGLIGAVQRGDFDATLPWLTPTYKRFSAVDFSEAYFYADVVLATRAPERKVDNFNWSYLYAFQWPSVLVFFSALILVSFLTAVASMQHSPETENSKIVAQFWIFLDTCTSLVTHNFHCNILKLHAFRIVIAFWSLAALVLSGAYTGILFSKKISLSNDYPFTDQETFVRCVEEKKCSLIMPTLSISYYLLLTQPGNSLSDRLSNAFLSNPVIIESQENILNTILNRKNIYLVWLWSKEEIFYGTKGNESCNYYMVNADFKDVEAFAVRKHSPLLNSLSEVALIFRESGLANTVRNKYLQPPCDNRQNAVSSVDGRNGLSAFSTIFYLYVVGVFGASILFVVERFVQYYNRNSVFAF